MTDYLDGFQRLEQLARQFTRIYERPHLVVLAQAELVQAIRDQGFEVTGPEMLPGSPRAKRYFVPDLALTIDAVFDVPNTRARITVSASAVPCRSDHG